MRSFLSTFFPNASAREYLNTPPLTIENRIDHPQTRFISDNIWFNFFQNFSRSSVSLTGLEQALLGATSSQQVKKLLQENQLLTAQNHFRDNMECRCLVAAIVSPIEMNKDLAHLIACRIRMLQAKLDTYNAFSDEYKKKTLGPRIMQLQERSSYISSYLERINTQLNVAAHAYAGLIGDSFQVAASSGNLLLLNNLLKIIEELNKLSKCKLLIPTENLYNEPVIAQSILPGELLKAYRDAEKNGHAPIVERLIEAFPGLTRLNSANP